MYIFDVIKRILGIKSEGVIRLVIVFLLPFYFFMDSKLYDYISDSELPIVTPENIEDYLNDVFGSKVTHKPHSESYIKSEYEKYINPILDSLENDLEEDYNESLKRYNKKDYDKYSEAGYRRSIVRYADSMLVNNIPLASNKLGWYDNKKKNFIKDMPTIEEFKELKSKFIAFDTWGKKSFFNESPDVYKWSGRPKILKFNWDHSRLVTSVFYTLFLYLLIIWSFNWVLRGFNIKF